MTGHTAGMIALRASLRAQGIDPTRPLEDQHAPAVLPPPRLPRVVVDPATPDIPKNVLGVYRAAIKAGWRARITFAIGPRIGSRAEVLEEECYSFAVAVQEKTAGAPPRRLVFSWHFLPSKAAYAPVEAQDYRTGKLYTITEGRKMLT